MKFSELMINENIVKAMNDLNLKALTPIQEKAIPLILQGNDILAKAPTGTGKTFAYVLPSLDKINNNHKSIQILVLCPTRELALQNEKSFKQASKYLDYISVSCLYGGVDINKQIRDIKKGANVIIATPGRLLDHIRRKTIKLHYLKTLILDEADEMLNMGFKEDIDNILENINSKKLQTLLFSATMPKEILKISTSYQNKPKKIDIEREQNEKNIIKQYYLEVSEANKLEALTNILDEVSYKKAIVFIKTKKKTDELAITLEKLGYNVDSIHGDLLQSKREAVIAKFKSNHINILLATDVAARGIDINDVELIINNDLPDDNEYYVHRIGRTGRAGKNGISITFFNKREHNYIDLYSKLTNSKIEKYELSDKKVAFKNRIHKYLNSLDKDTLNKEMYTQVINAYLENNNLSYQDLVYILISNTIKPLVIKEKEKKNFDKLRKETLDLKKKKDVKYQKYFINIGEKDGLDKKALLALLLKECKKVNRDDFCEVFTLDNFSFFHLDKRKEKDIMNALNGKKYKKRIINIEISSKSK